MTKTPWYVALAFVAGLSLAGLTHTVTAAESSATAAAAPGVQGPLAHSLLGRLITGTVGRLLTLRAELNLTDEQRQAIKTTLQSHREEIAQVLTPLVAKKRALRDAVTTDQPDEKAIRAASEDLGKAIGDAAVLAAKIRGEIRTHAHLTDEQLQKIKEFRTQTDASVDQFLQRLDQAK